MFFPTYMAQQTTKCSNNYAVGERMLINHSILCNIQKQKVILIDLDFMTDANTGKIDSEALF